MVRVDEGGRTRCCMPKGQQQRHQSGRRPGQQKPPSTAAHMWPRNSLLARSVASASRRATTRSPLW